MKRRYVVCNVFTQDAFGGNPLSVVLDAEDLSTKQMQQIARQFNYSETTFVLPPKQGGDFNVRIFTPSSEVPFAGHPNVGTAFVLSQEGLLGDASEFEFEEKAGRVPVSVTRHHDGVFTELTAPETLSVGNEVPAETMARLLSLNLDEIKTDKHLPIEASVGLPFIVVELTSYDALKRAKVNSAELEKLVAAFDHPFMHLYVRSNDEFDLRTRMFAPTDGVPEDPATGSANCALAALLAHLDIESDLEQQLSIAQGVEMGRPSQLSTRVVKVSGAVIDVKIGGYSVEFSRGTFSC